MSRKPSNIDASGCGPMAVCNKEQELGRMEAKLENHENNVSDIRSRLETITVTNDKDRRAFNEQFIAITAEISKMSQALQSSAETSKMLLENQNKLLQDLNQLVVSNQNTTTIQSNIDAAMKAHIDQAVAWQHDIDKRVVALETKNSNRLAISAFIMSALTILALAAEIIRALWK